MLDSIKFDYFFLQDYSGAKDYIEKINNYNPNICRKFYGRMMSSQGVEHCIIPDYQIEKANAELYYTSYPNKVFHYDISSFPLADFHTVANSAFHFALWTHPTKIYLVGCDCSSTYFDGSKGKSFSYLIDGWKKAVRRFILSRHRSDINQPSRPSRFIQRYEHVIRKTES